MTVSAHVSATGIVFAVSGLGLILVVTVSALRDEICGIVFADCFYCQELDCLCVSKIVRQFQGLSLRDCPKVSLLVLHLPVET